MSATRHLRRGVPLAYHSTVPLFRPARWDPRWVVRPDELYRDLVCLVREENGGYVEAF